MELDRKPSEEEVRPMMHLAHIDQILATFPCGFDKKPRNRHGHNDAIRGMSWHRAELVGVPTGEVNGFDVLDVDKEAGRKWYDKHYDAIPPTLVHSTQRGMHLLWKYRPGLQCSTSKIAPGIDVRTDGGYVIWWPREGLPVEDPGWISEWPEWLWQEAKRGPARKVYHSTSKLLVPVHPSEVASLTEALFKLDPVEWRSRDLEGEEGRDRQAEWLAIAQGCKFDGISEDDWVAWCIQDEIYLGDEATIRRRWRSLTPRHNGAFRAALARRGIKVRGTGDRKARRAVVPISATEGVSARSRALPPNVKSRSSGIINWLSKNQTGDGLFSAACLFAEMGVTEENATKLIKGNIPSLYKALGDHEFHYQITKAYQHINSKRPV
jgi:hypothetical protein